MRMCLDRIDPPGGACALDVNNATPDAEAAAGAVRITLAILESIERFEVSAVLSKTKLEGLE